MIESSTGFKQRTRAVRVDFCASRTHNASYYNQNATLLHNKDRGGRNFGLYSGNAAADGLLEWRDGRRRSDTTVCGATREMGMKHGGNREKLVLSDLAKCTMSSKRRIDDCGRSAGRMGTQMHWIDDHRCRRRWTKLGHDRVRLGAATAKGV